MKIDREIASKTLTDSFCLLYGEKFRTLFEENGEKLIDLGIKNAIEYFTEYAVDNTTKSHVYVMTKFFQPNKFYNSLDEMKSSITTGLKPFLSDSDIEKLFTDREYSSFTGDRFAEPKGIGIFQSNIIKGLDESKPKPIRKLEFDYFKQFPIYKTSSSVSLATEGGLGLDQFNYTSVKYYLEEDEEFYLAEAIPYKYHALGSVLGREQLRSEMVDKLKSTITPDSDYEVKEVLRYMLAAYCFGSEEDSTLLDVQSVCGVEGFQTSIQISNSIKKIDKSVLKRVGDMFNEKKIIKNFNNFINK